MIRQPIYEPSNGKDGYQVESWLESQLAKGAKIVDKNGRRLRHVNPIGYRTDGSPIWPIEGGSFITGTSVELIYANIAAGTAKATFTSEFASLNDTTGMGALAHVPVDFWTPSNTIGKALRIEAWGIVSSTATPTYTFTTRMGTAGSTTAAIVAGTAALTTASGITNLSWSGKCNLVLTVVGAAGANSTIRGLGTLDGGTSVFSTNGGGNPFNASASATAPTVATLDTSIVNYVNMNITCSASSGSNSIQLLGLYVWGLN